MAAPASRALTTPLRTLVLGSGRIGHEVNARGVVEALGGGYELRPLAPRRLYARLAPWGPVDPRDVQALAGPAPEILIASGRVTVPYVRAWKRAHPQVFTVFLQDPRWARGEMDLIWMPDHDSWRGPNVMTTLTSPHPFSPARLAAERAAPDARLARLPAPRCAVALGGPSGAQHFTPQDVARMGEALRAIRAQGFAIMATPSRRTPPDLAAFVREAVGDGFFWDGSGDNPYPAMLALADAVLVTGDSANMVGEATATGAPVHVFEPSGGGSKKLSGAIDALIARGAVRRWTGRLEDFRYAPIDSSAEIAAEIGRRYAARKKITAPSRAFAPAASRR
jgi:mitochondrial fission protein ELM1